nr:hypothetical protein [Vibrio neptunius]
MLTRGESGNVMTEDVVYLCPRFEGIETGVDLHRLAQAGWGKSALGDALGRPTDFQSVTGLCH